jgi:hypothetical protein
MPEQVPRLFSSGRSGVPVIDEYFGPVGRHLGGSAVSDPVEGVAEAR